MLVVEQVRRIKPLTQLEPGRNSPCLCGSGKKFKRCCMEVYKSHSLNESFQLFNKGKYEEALLACRRHVTWYRLCHYAHTMPMLLSGNKRGNDLLIIDLEALADSIGLLHRCYSNVGRSDDFPTVLEYLSEAIDDSRWQDKVKYFKAIWWLIDKQDREAALSCLTGVDFDVCRDPKILEVFIDVAPSGMSFKKKIELIERVIKYINKPSEILQYSLLKGIAYFLISEISDACLIISKAIEEYELVDKEEKTTYGYYQYAHGLQILGEISSDATKIRDAVTQFSLVLKIAQEDNYTPVFFADIEREIGNCYSDLGEFDTAVQHYKNSVERFDSGLTRVFQARANTNLEKLDESRDILAGINSTHFDVHEYFDYAITWGMIALKSQDAMDIEQAKKHLRNSETVWPFFESKRDKLLISLLEASPKQEKGTFRRLTSQLNRYISLNPNVFGVGIDLNKIVEDLHTRRKK